MSWRFYQKSWKKKLGEKWPDFLLNDFKGFWHFGYTFLGKEICDAMAGRIRGFRRVMTRTFCSNFEWAQIRLKSNARLKKSTFGSFLPKSWFPNFTGFFGCTFWRHFFTFRNRSFWTKFWLTFYAIFYTFGTFGTFLAQKFIFRIWSVFGFRIFL